MVLQDTWLFHGTIRANIAYGRPDASESEILAAAEATYVVNQIQKRIMQGRPPKVGDRQVEVLFSSQEELMGELFPRAKNVRWEGSAPVVLDNPQMFYPGVEAADFTGFLQGEEVVMVVKHAETPFRVSF